MQQIYDLIKYLGTAPAILAVILIPVACVVAAAFVDPQGAVNTFLIKVIDLLFEFWPSTPDEFQIGSMLTQLIVSLPGIGWGPIKEIFQGVTGILLLVLFFKLVKIIPFI